ncbi:MAG: hypothetical protein ABI461_09350 [Polyangiaceae bacterium]
MDAWRASVLLVGVLASGCVEMPDATDARAEAHAQDQPARVAVDDFWLDQQIAAWDEHPAPRPKSISLGYAGDSPLSNGVMRNGVVDDYGQVYGSSLGP